MTKTMSPTKARAICTRAVVLVTGALASTDWTAPPMWADARKVEAADDRRWYATSGSVKARTAPEREAVLVLVMIGPVEPIERLYGRRAAHRDDPGSDAS